MPQPKRKKQDYEIMLTSTQIHRATVKALSAEQACKILQRKIGAKPVRHTSTTAELIEHVWSDPCENGEAWMVVPAENKTPGQMMIWNGKRLEAHTAEELFDKMARLPAKKRRNS